MFQKPPIFPLQSVSPRHQAANPTGPAPMQLPSNAACPILRYLLGLRDINAPAGGDMKRYMHQDFSNHGFLDT